MVPCLFNVSGCVCLLFPHVSLHVTTEGNFEVGQSSFSVRVTQSSDAINNEAIICNGCLKTLLAIPCRQNRMRSVAGSSLTDHVQVMLDRRSGNVCHRGAVSYYYCVLTFELRSSSWSEEWEYHSISGNPVTYPSAMRMKSANPWTITVRLLFSITLGRTLRAEGKLPSPRGKTSESEHSVQVTLGAWIACLTSDLSK